MSAIQSKVTGSPDDVILTQPLDALDNEALTTTTTAPLDDWTHDSSSLGAAWRVRTTQAATHGGPAGSPLLVGGRRGVCRCGSARHVFSVGVRRHAVGFWTITYEYPVAV